MLIISTIPKDRKHLELLRNKYKDYYFEYRMDLCKDTTNLVDMPVDDFTILTFRDKEGIELKEKINLLSKMQKRYNCFIDIELENINSVNLECLDKKKTIVSCHLENWTEDQLSDIIAAMNETKAGMLKIALNMPDWKKLNLISELIAGSKKAVLFAPMGNLGISQRCLYKHIGAEGTYLGIDGELTAEGQLPISIAEEINLNTINSESLLCGIIGSSQIIMSNGLKYYGKLFAERELSMHYIPFIVEDIHDFKCWLNKSPIKDKITGFSVTMPFKRDVTKNTSSSHEVANLWNGDEGFYNTDLIAMKGIITDLNLKRNSRILIAGSGGSAHTALMALQGMGMQVFVSARNFVDAFRLIKPFDAGYIIPENVKLNHFELVVNTTPLGMNNENVLDMFPVKSFDNVIDLPYINGETPLQQVCLERGITYIGGHDFWRRQSIDQEEYFLKNYKKVLGSSNGRTQ